MNSAKTNIQNLILQGQLKEALELLLEKSTSTAEKRVIASLLSQYNDAKLQHLEGLSSAEDFGIIKNRLTKLVLQHLDDPVQVLKTQKTVGPWKWIFGILLLVSVVVVGLYFSSNQPTTTERSVTSNNIPQIEKVQIQGRLLEDGVNTAIPNLKFELYHQDSSIVLTSDKNGKFQMAFSSQDGDTSFQISLKNNPVYHDFSRDFTISAANLGSLYLSRKDRPKAVRKKSYTIQVMGKAIDDPSIISRLDLSDFEYTLTNNANLVLRFYTDLEEHLELLQDGKYDYNGGQLKLSISGKPCLLRTNYKIAGTRGPRTRIEIERYVKGKIIQHLKAPTILQELRQCL